MDQAYEYIQPAIEFVRAHPIEVIVTLFVVGARYLGWSPKWLAYLTRNLAKACSEGRGGRAILAGLMLPPAAIIDAVASPVAIAAGIQGRGKDDDARWDRYFDAVMDLHRRQSALREQVGRMPSYDEFAALQDDVDKILGRRDPRTRDA